eukprot:8655989-Alexandrium_andersonii.AAC.1
MSPPIARRGRLRCMWTCRCGLRSPCCLWSHAVLAQLHFTTHTHTPTDPAPFAWTLRSLSAHIPLRF